jgi:potassium efflux system protein
MRSLTVYTGDHTEVIVPHSEAFSKTFVNWTLQDSIVRGTVVIKIAREDDPHVIQTAVVQVLKETQGVVANPAPEVLLKDINDTAIEFQIHYFINLQVTPYRSVMRSTVLFSVWDCLSKMGLRPLHAQQDVHIKALPAN